MSKMKWVGIGMLLMCLFMFGCMPKGIQTESGQPMNEKMISLYAFIDYSKMLSDEVGMLASDLYDRNYIDEEEKEEVGKVWKRHKRYHNLLQEEYMLMYEKVNGGEKIDDYSRVYALTKKIVEETNMLEKLMERLFGDIYVPDTLISRIYELYVLINEIEEMETETETEE